MREEAFLLGMLEQPDDITLRLVFADWLEENNDPRGELLRLTHSLTHNIDLPNRAGREERLRSLLATGVRPVGPRWTNSLGMQFTWVPPGIFVMGSPPHEAERQDNETPRHVTLNRGFYLGVHAVTQVQWEAVMGTNPSRFRGEDRPVECVSWEDCQDFCKQLALKVGLGREAPCAYRLPSEAEWEYACRAGTTTPFYFGYSLSTHQANYHTNYGRDREDKGKYRQETTSVGTFPENAWGLADMHGNVYEWCADWYSAYTGADVKDPQGHASGDVRVLRGGCWNSLAGRCRSACRGWTAPGYRGSDVGFRICFRVEPQYVI
jgi:uncharacterized protein (TIGR02996 family)